MPFALAAWGLAMRSSALPLHHQGFVPRTNILEVRCSASAALAGMLVQVMLGDRSQEATMKRLQYYTRHLTRQDSKRQVGWVTGWLAGAAGMVADN